MQDQIFLINKVLANKQYHAQGKLNQGSYGQIFKVVHNQTKQVYALKALQLTKLEKLLKMYEVLIEICILQKLSHPGIIRLYQKIQMPSYIGLVLDYCPHGDMFNLMRNINKNIELINKKQEITVFYLAQIIDALDYLHGQGIIHRDIKPQNIVIGDDNNIRIIDFGTGKITNQNFLTQKEKQQICSVREVEGISDQTLVGSLNYLSPQVLKLNYTDKCDIWAFGVIAYKFCYNRFPFEGKDTIQIFKKIAEDDVIFQGGSLSPQFQELLEMALKKDPKQRASAKQLKKCSIFKKIDFQNIFKTKSPLPEIQLKKINTNNSSDSFLLQIPLEKRMFFGNFKTRLLTMSQSDGRLFMAYRYLPSKTIKHQFQINLNDYAQVFEKKAKAEQFEVVTVDKRYRFRPSHGETAQELVNRINQVIKSYYKLD